MVGYIWESTLAENLTDTARCWEGGSEFAYLGGVRTSEWFEVLCGFEGVEWIPFNGHASMPGWQPVEGGRAKSKQWAVLVARGMVDG